LKRAESKRLTKDEKEKAVLFSLVKSYIMENKPIGSSFLQESSLKDISSATIRNYFSKLEKDGFLEQKHTSGGRIPTYRAYRAFVDMLLENQSPFIDRIENTPKKLDNETKEISNFLKKVLEDLSNKTNLCAFFSCPRFDHDFIQNIKLVKIDDEKIICIVITDFGVIKTETLFTEHNLKDKEIDLLEKFFLWRLSKADKPKKMDEKLLSIAKKFYNEIIIRHVVSYTNSATEEIERTGLSKLFNYEEFEDPKILANGLSIFENSSNLHKILDSCCIENKLTCFIGKELESIDIEVKEVGIIAIPYKINQITAGAIALLGPMRLDYDKLINTLKAYAEYITETLTKSVYKYKISFSKTTSKRKDILLDYEKSLLLDQKTLDNNSNK
jgi:heat-inducible transcriptional repressor